MKRAGAIGLTGGIACGKSEVAGVLRGEGIPVYDTDTAAHALLEPGHWVYEKVAQEFGHSYVGPDGGIDRRKLGELVFNDAGQRDVLNRIMHPVIIEGMLAWLDDQLSRVEHAVVMVPLLYETGADQYVEKVLAIAADEERVIERLRNRGLTRDQSMARINSQMPLAEKTARADAVIWNNNDLPALKKSVLEIWNKQILGKEIEHE